MSQAVVKTLAEFVTALRKADVDVSPAETLDAMSALEVVGLSDRQLLRHSLSMVLAKSISEKAAFETCFDRFFGFDRQRVSEDYLQSLKSRHDELSVTGGQLPGSSSGRHRNRKAPQEAASGLKYLLLSGDSQRLMLAVSGAADAVGIDRIRKLRERSLFAHRILVHLGVNGLKEEIARHELQSSQSDLQTAALLTDALSYLTDTVRAYVDNQYQLRVDGTGNRFIVEAVSSTQLTVMQPFYFDQIREVVRQLAHRLAKRHARRRRITKKGQLDVRKTLRRNLAYDGTLFDLQWKQVRLDRPRVFVLCDVSGSVRNVARFLLTFLYSLGEVLPNVRSFAFSNELGEVTRYFDDYGPDDAIEMSLSDYGNGATDYGSAFRAFWSECADDIDDRTTLIIMGDARSNYYEPGTEVLKRMSHKSRQLIWLNPEPRSSWEEGDAEMGQYLRYCDVAEVCNSLADLEKMVTQVLRSAE